MPDTHYSIFQFIELRELRFLSLSTIEHRYSIIEPFLTFSRLHKIF